MTSNSFLCQSLIKFVPFKNKISKMYPTLLYPHIYDTDYSYTKYSTLSLEKDKESPLHKAIVQKSLHQLRQCMNDPKIDINERNKNYETPLLAALRIEDTTVAYSFAKILLKKAPNLHLQDSDGFTPLHEAARRHLKLLNLLIQKKIIINARNFLGETPLHVACNEEIVRRLLRCGAHVNEVDNSGNTPLHSHVCSVDICQMLLDSGANPNATNIQGQSVLHAAVIRNLVETVKLLVTFGADVNLILDSKQKITVLYSAFASRACKEIKTMLCERSRLANLIFVVNFDSAKIPYVVSRWNTVGNDERDITILILTLLQLLDDCKDMKWVACTRVVADFFLKKIQFLSKSNCREILDSFSNYLYRSLLSFLLKTHDYTGPDCYTKIENLVDVLVSNGEILDFSDLELIYFEFKDCALLHKLKQILISPKLKSFRKLPDFLRLHYDPSLDINKFVKCFSLSNIDIVDFYNLHNISRYAVLPTGLIEEFKHSYYNICKFVKVDFDHMQMSDVFEILERKRGVPSMLELARNATRLFLAKKFKLRTAVELHLFVQKLELSKFLTRVILLDFPLHHDIPLPNYTPYLKYMYLL